VLQSKTFKRQFLEYSKLLSGCNGELDLIGNTS
jgi:hypothetical protein